MSDVYPDGTSIVCLHLIGFLRNEIVLARVDYLRLAAWRRVAANEVAQFVDESHAHDAWPSVRGGIQSVADRFYLQSKA